MASRRLGFIVATVVLACAAAAGTGAYMALHGKGGAQPVAATSTAVPLPAAREAASVGVAETEEVVDEIQGSPSASAATSSPVSQRESAKSSRPSAVRRPVPAPPARRSPAPDAPSPREAAPVAETISGTSGEIATTPAPVTTPTTAPEATTAGDAPMSETEAAAATEPEEPRKTFEELIVPADSVLGLQLETTLTSERAKVEDSVNARVTRDVRVGDHVAIPAGTKVMGSVTLVDRGGKVKEKARLGIRFHTLVLADGTHQSINTDTIYREGSSPAGESTAKIAGGAVAGAILGAILGGGKGAVIGGTAGAGGGTAAVMAGGRNPATVQAGSTMTARIVDPVTITVEREEEK